MNEQGKDKTLLVRVITPEEEFFSSPVESAVLRTAEGYMGFLPGRAPACVLLHDEGSIRFRLPGEKDFARAFLAGGFAFMDESLTIYTDKAAWQVEGEPADLAAEPLYTISSR